MCNHRRRMAILTSICKGKPLVTGGTDNYPDFFHIS